MEEGLRAGRTPRSQWGPVLDQMQEAAQAISEVAHGRWAKLLGSRYALLVRPCARFCTDSRLCKHVCKQSVLSASSVDSHLHLQQY